MNEKDQQPVILLIHGAWHRPLHYRLLIQSFQQQGFTVLAPPLASSGYDDSVDGKTYHDDVKRIHDAVLPYIASGRKVIGIGHSYGALPLTVAIEGHSIAEREQRGLTGGFSSVIYVAPTPVLHKGISIYEAAGEHRKTPFFHDVSDTRMPLKLDRVKEAFLSDIHESIADEIIPTLCHQSKAPFEVPIVCTPADLAIPKTMVICKNDPIFGRDMLLGVAQNWGADTLEIESGHSPHLMEDHGKWLVELVSKEAKRPV
ncbi:pyrethroid hydrolase [Fusarium pseudocircinatum]|uniref:Pyrethroid hydrolase n=1 Tax=Fusarium pseudocircinatum TaxID=56676 RepID=A0A8H5NXQ7_9HYPO|nr:pyrethroid hydrolase [Fusarium pseudocircinatum]